MISFKEIIKKYGEGEVHNPKLNRHNTGGDMLMYSEIYDELFRGIRTNPISLLEIGICQGRGLAAWADYFFNGKIYGVDITLEMFNEYKQTLIDKGAFLNKNLIEVTELNSINTSFSDDHTTRYDIIIDDASHKPDDQLCTYKNFKNFLSPIGIYVIEDVKKDSVDFLTSNIDNTLLKSNGGSRLIVIENK